jgi:hypothetical protein
MARLTSQPVPPILFSLLQGEVRNVGVEVKDANGNPQSLLGFDCFMALEAPGRRLVLTGQVLVPSTDGIVVFIFDEAAHAALQVGVFDFQVWLRSGGVQAPRLTGRCEIKRTPQPPPVP